LAEVREVAVGGDPPLVALEQIRKRYGGTVALRDVSLEVVEGEIHGLVGANGAGKSTLGKVIGGAVRPDSGTMSLLGTPLPLRSPRDALRAGIARIAQEPTLVRTLSAEENVFLGQEATRHGNLDGRALRRRFRELTESIGFSVRPNAPARSLSLADQQKVEILRALSRSAKLVVMDEPTAALAPHETEYLLATVRLLRARGVTVVYVSHELSHVLELCDRLTVMRDGAAVATMPAAAATAAGLVRAMVGHEPVLAGSEQQAGRVAEEALLEVDGLRTRDAGPLSFRVASGEILGIAGAPGSGKSSIGRVLFGAERLRSGDMLLAGRSYLPRHPAHAVRQGVAFVPQSRANALVMCLSVLENISLPTLRDVSPAGVLRTGVERHRARDVVSKLAIRVGRVSAAVSTLSGGNQQKVVFGRWTLRTPRVLVVDEPTRGIDVAAKEAIYDILVSLAREGVAVVLISMEADDVLRLADRILVLRRGRVVTELSRGSVERAELLHLMLGETADEAAG